MNEQILRKIKRCMELSSSSNEHEAALAIKQMQALMQKHGVNEKNVLAMDVREELYQLDVKKRPAQWVLSLQVTISEALDCSPLVWSSNYSNIKLGFLGVDAMPEIASYAFDVLYRQLKKNRQEYIETKLKRYKRINKIKMADAYCTGWVNNVYSKVENLSPNQEIAERIKAYQETKIKNWDPEEEFSGLSRFDSKNSKVLKAMSDGFNESKDVKLFAATGHQGRKQLGGPL